jgi:hypothetical protein
MSTVKFTEFIEKTNHINRKIYGIHRENKSFQSWNLQNSYRKQIMSTMKFTEFIRKTHLFQLWILQNLYRNQSQTHTGELSLLTGDRCLWVPLFTLNFNLHPYKYVSVSFYPVLRILSDFIIFSLPTKLCLQDTVKIWKLMNENDSTVNHILFIEVSLVCDFIHMGTNWFTSIKIHRYCYLLYSMTKLFCLSSVILKWLIDLQNKRPDKSS